MNRIQQWLAAGAITLLPCAALALPTVASLPAGAVPSSLTAAAMADAAQPLALNLPDGSSVSLPAQRRDYGEGRIGAVARRHDGLRFYGFVSGERMLSADVYSRSGHYELVSHQGRAYWISARTESAKPDALMRPTPRTHTTTAPTTSPGADGLYEISVLVLHTPLYAQRMAPTTPEEEAQRLVFLASEYMATSAVPVRYRLVGVAPYTGTDENSGFYDNLASMVGNPQVSALRNRTEADLVMLLRSQDGNADLCGLSSGFNNFERSDPPESINTERDAYNVAGLAPAEGSSASCFDDVFAHELGHSLAAGHDYAGSAGFQYWKPFSHALPCVNASGLKYFSLMWSIGVGPGGGRSELITNPDLLLDGHACGADGVDGIEASQANNARAMAEAAPYVAAYRGKASASSGGGSTVTVSVGGSLAWLTSLGLALLGLGRRRRGRA